MLQAHLYSLGWPIPSGEKGRFLEFMFNFMTQREHFCSLLLWSYRIHVVFSKLFAEKSSPFHRPLNEYLAPVPPIGHNLKKKRKKEKKSYKLPEPAVVFETGCSKCVLCAFKGVRSGSNCTESITDLFKFFWERSRVIKVWSLARVVFNSSIIKASLKCHPLFTSSIKCLTSMMWFLIKTLLK